MVGTLLKYSNALLVATALAVGVAAVSAVPARAEFESYGCTECASQNGNEVLAKEAMKAYGEVLFGAKGVCAAVYENIGGGKYKEYLSCTATGTSTSAVTGFIGAFSGHGQVRRYYKEFLYGLYGEELWI